jgi:hypothetical protein
MKQFLPNIRPKLVEGVVAKAAEKSESGTDGGVAEGSIAIRAPAVGKEVAARERYEAGIGWLQISIAILRHVRHLNRVSDAILEWRSGVACVARIRCWPVMGGRASLLLEEDEASVPGSSNSWAMATEANKRIRQVTLQIIFCAFIGERWQIAFQCGCLRRVQDS